MRLIFRFQTSGRHNVPRGRPYIVVANHLNWLDSFALLIALPRTPQLHFVGWNTILKSRRLSKAIRFTRFGLIPIDRDPKMRSKQIRETMESLGRCLDSGFPLVLYPEGQVGCDEGKVAPFHSGFARLAEISGAPILPVALSGTRRLWLGKRVKIVIGAPIAAVGPGIDALLERARDAIIDVMPAPPDDSRGMRLFERRLTRLIPSLTNWWPSDF